MLPKELAKKVRYIQIHTNKTVNDSLAGEYHSVFKGQGMEFDEVREYQPGDEIRSIDWNVTARTGRPHVKRFREERELTIFLLVDLSASGRFGSVRQFKNEIATELCALVAFSAVKNNDKIGLVVFTGDVELFIPPKKGVSHVLRLIRDLLSYEPKGRGTNVAKALNYLGRVTHKRGVVFLVSDFLDDGYERAMRIVSKRHDLIAVSVADPRETMLPNVGLIELEDAETGSRVLVDTSSAAVRKRYETLGHERQARLRERLAAMDVDHIEISTGRDYTRDLVKFFRMRERRN